MTASDQLRNLHGDLGPREGESIADHLGRYERLTYRIEDALPLIADAIAAAEAELPTCREWLDHPERGPHRCDLPADIIIWGALTTEESRGPRCFAHACDHYPRLTNPSYVEQFACVDLRPRRRALAALDAALTQEENPDGR